MDKVKRARKKALIRAIIFTVLLVAGIPMIPIGFVFAAKTTGAVHGILIAVAIAGIAFTAVGFYGTPIAWTSFGNFAPIVRLLYAIEKECIYDVPTLATYLHRREKDIQGTIRTAIDKLYLEGYFFDGTKLTLNENKKLKAKPIYTKCPNCGASLPTPQDGDESVTCKYCGSVFPIK